jgi:predicted nuclease of predicted toxin-antitoxin system
MRILLDECLPARLRRSLNGHEVQTVPRAGWAGIKNGTLLGLISDSGKFEIFLTMDKSLPQQQQLKGLSFAVVILRAKSNRFEDTHPLMAPFLNRLTEFQPGEVYLLIERE